MNLLWVGSIFLVADVYGSVWLQHESLPLVPPPRGAVVAVDSLDATIVQPVAITSEAAKSEVVAGPNSGATIVQGSVAGPVTVRAGSSAAGISGIVPLAGTRGGVSEGSITAAGPFDGSITVTGGADGSTTTAVVGPSTGPVVIAGPDAVPVPTIPEVLPVPEVVGVHEANIGIIGTGESQVLIEGAISSPIVLQASGRLISQEILDNTILVREPKVVSARPATVLVAAKLPEVAVAGPSTGNIAIAGPKSAATVVAGPSGTIATSRTR